MMVREFDRYAAEPYVLGEDEDYTYLLTRMLTNWRVLMDPKADPGFPDYGWCFRSAEAAVLAYQVWDPPTQDEPLGWHKRPAYGLRQAPMRHLDPEYNRPRCDHGGYLGAGCRDAPHCDEQNARKPRP